MNFAGIGFDVHRFASGRKLFLGGCEIPYEKGLKGHSDADVLCHAIMDALLGAAATGDIGLHFPDSDEKWKNASSVELLKRVVSIIMKKGFKPVNVDSTVLAEAPKLKNYIPAMRQKLAEAVGVSIERISVKATTMEGMGAVGRKEGIAAMAVVTIRSAGRKRG